MKKLLLGTAVSALLLFAAGPVSALDANGNELSGNGSQLQATELDTDVKVSDIANTDTTTNTTNTTNQNTSSDTDVEVNKTATIASGNVVDSNNKTANLSLSNTQTETEVDVEKNTSIASGNTTHNDNDVAVNKSATIASGNTTNDNDVSLSMSKTETDINVDKTATVASGNTTDSYKHTTNNYDNSETHVLNTAINHSDSDVRNTSIGIEHHELLASQTLSAAVSGNNISFSYENEAEESANAATRVRTGSASFDMAGNGVVSNQSQTGLNNAGTNAMTMAIQMNGGL